MDHNDFDQSKKAIDLYPIVDSEGVSRYVDKDEYSEYCKSHDSTHTHEDKVDDDHLEKSTESVQEEVCSTDNMSSGEERVNYDNLLEFRDYIQRRVEDIRSRDPDIHEDFQYTSYDDFVKSVQEEVQSFFEEDQKEQGSSYIPGTHILKPRDRKVEETDQEHVEYLHNYYNVEHDTDFETISYIPGTNIIKPRNREVEETDQEYVEYLRNYYSVEHDTDFETISYIPGTNIIKPRNRKVEETDQEYVEYLRNYYNVEHGKDFYPGKKHQVLSHKKNCKSQLLKIILTICTFAMVALYGLFGVGGKKQKDANSNGNTYKTAESVNDDMNDFTGDLDRDVEKEIKNIINHKKYKKATTSTVGDVVKLKEDTTYYYDAQLSKPTGRIGNLYSSKNSSYIVDGIALVNHENQIIATSYEGGFSAREMMEMYGLDKSHCRVMYHISLNHNKLQLQKGKASNRGWIAFQPENYQLKKNISKSKVYSKRK